MTDFAAAIKRPFTNGKILLIGGLLSIVPIANFIPLGYALKAGLKPDAKLPGWVDLGGLLKTGFFAFLGSLLYMLPGLIGIIVSVIAAIGTSISSNSSPSLWTIFLFILSLLYLFVAQYLTGAALLHYAAEDRFSAIFEFKYIFAVAFTKAYLLATLAAFGWSFLLGLLAVFPILILYITIIGPLILQGILNFAISITIFTLYGQIYKEVL